MGGCNEEKVCPNHTSKEPKKVQHNALRVNSNHQASETTRQAQPSLTGWLEHGGPKRLTGRSKDSVAMVEDQVERKANGKL